MPEMKVEILASVMNSRIDTVITQMCLDSDAVIINQCDSFGFEEKMLHDSRVRLFSFPDRGIGRSRNEAILRAEGDICLFADEDIVYEKGYQDSIVREFEKNPRADMILFQVEVGEERRTYRITDRKKVHWYNCGRYGAVSFAIRREKLLESGVMFSLLFGGGAKYSNGEDSLFLKEFMDKGYRVYTAPVTIGREKAQASTWFQGYNEKFFHDRGVLYHFLYGKAASLLGLRFLLAHKNTVCKDVRIGQAFHWMREGIREVS